MHARGAVEERRPPRRIIEGRYEVVFGFREHDVIPVREASERIMAGAVAPRVPFEPREMTRPILLESDDVAFLPRAVGGALDRARDRARPGDPRVQVEIDPRGVGRKMNLVGFKRIGLVIPELREESLVERGRDVRSRPESPGIVAVAVGVDTPPLFPGGAPILPAPESLVVVEAVVADARDEQSCTLNWMRRIVPHRS